MSDPYLLHLEEIIKAAQKQLDEANTARDNYLRFKKSSPQSTASRPAPKTEEITVSDRKGLRAFGHTRDLYEYYYRTPDGANIKEAVAKTGYTMKKVAHFQHRALHEGTLIRAGDKYVLSEAGRALVEKSQAYAGDIEF